MRYIKSPFLLVLLIFFVVLPPPPPLKQQEAHYASVTVLCTLFPLLQMSKINLLDGKAAVSIVVSTLSKYLFTTIAGMDFMVIKICLHHYVPLLLVALCGLLIATR